MPSAEEDYIERAREIWDAWQFHIYVGLAMVLAVIAGFTLSHSSFNEDRAAANAALYQLVDLADDQQIEEATAAYAALSAYAEFPELAHLGAFVLSSLHYAAGDYAAAADTLQPALENSADKGVRHLAALRTAEAMMAAGDAADAARLLARKQPTSGRIRILFEERAGDAHFAAGDIPAAQAAYQRAIDIAEEEATFYESLLNIKLSALLSTPQAARAAAAAAAAADTDTESGTATEDGAPAPDTPEDPLQTTEEPQ